MERRVSLRTFGRHLWTRASAREPRGQLEAILDESDAGDTVVIDVDGVEVFDYSFANEYFGKTLLALPRSYSGRFLVVEGLTEYTRENLEKALESLGLAIVERHAGSVRLLGKVHPTDQETFSAIVRVREPVAATTLRDLFAINVTAMNERLTKLTSLGLVRRERGISTAGREQYVYSAPS